MVLSAGMLLLLAVPAALYGQSGFVTGTVKSVHGGPLAGVQVTLSRETDGEEPLVARQTTTESGRFAFKVGAEDSGEFLLRFEAEGYAPAEGLVRVVWGRAKVVDMKLVPWEEAVRNDPDTAVQAGFDAFEAGNLEDAVTYFEAALATDPNKAEAHRGLAEAHLRGGRPAEAAQEVEKYLAQRPGDRQGLRLAFDIYSALEDEQGIERTKRQLVAAGAGPEIASAIYNRGVDAYRLQALDKAAASFREALRLDPGLTDAAVALASIAYTQQRFAEAADRAADILESHPGNIKVARLRYLALDASDAPGTDQALTAYLALAPTAAVHLVLQRATDDFAAGRLRTAETSLLRLLTLRPDQPDAHFLLGKLYRESGEHGKAKEHLERFLELAPDHADADTARDMLESLTAGW